VACTVHLGSSVYDVARFYGESPLTANNTEWKR